MKKLTSLALFSTALAFTACSEDSTTNDPTVDASAEDDDVGAADDDTNPAADDADDDTQPADDDTDPANDDADDDTDPGDDDTEPADDDADDDVTDDDVEEDDDVTDDDDADDDLGDDDVTEPTEAGAPTRPTYYGDALAVFEARCLGCHQEGGIGPFRLDDYETAAQYAPLAKEYVEARIMPPYLLTDGEGCGDFQDSRYLSDEEIATISAWADGGALEGEPREVALPPLPGLDATEEIATPMFTPEAGGGELAEFDEYRCFLIDRRTTVDYEFITGYHVKPGNPAIVHHVLVSLVTETADSNVMNPDTGTPYTNGELIAQLDAASPDREGWPCYSGAGDGVSVGQLPIQWAPGQGAIHFPNESGAYVTPAEMMVAQVHYNLHDAELIGQADQTRIELQMSPIVTNVGFSLPIDPLLDSLNEGAPRELPPGNENVEVTWERSIGDLPVGIFPGLELWGVGPHMHELGFDYSFSGNIGGADACLADMTYWDFDWQLAYYYKEGIPVTETDTLTATCHYDTTSRTEPVLPGWGTQNEMCFTSLYFTAPVLSVASVLGL